MVNGKITLDGRFLLAEYEGGDLKFNNYSRISEWKSAQFHFHSPSEHTIDGKYFDAEMHMVFKGVTHKNEASVVGLLFEVDENAEKDLFLESLEIDKLSKGGKTASTGLNVSPAQIFKKLSNFENYHYQGSLTTPDYDEIINWFLFHEAIKIPQSQFETLHNFWNKDTIEGCVKGNARHLHSVGSRVIHRVKHTLKDHN